MFVSRVDFICSKLSNFSFHVYVVSDSVLEGLLARLPFPPVSEGSVERRPHHKGADCYGEAYMWSCYGRIDHMRTPSEETSVTLRRRQ